MRPIAIITAALAFLVLASGCTRTMTLVDMESGQTLKAEFTDTPGTNGTITVTMPDGEVLKGNYTGVREDERFGFTSATATASAHSSTGETAHVQGSGFSHGYSVGGQGKAYGLLTSTRPGSSLVMEILATYGVLSGHGYGKARTNDGRFYRVQF